ncbi:MAG: rhodanese-like domain-containing protein, partial [Planctomycetota bacterium]
MRHFLFSYSLFYLLLVSSFLQGQSKLQDAESSSHTDTSASLQVLTQENQGNDFIFRQYQLGVLSHYSYLIGSQGIALIVDPSRDIQTYLQEAQTLNLKIKYVYLTHSHADFVAGHLELAQATGATILMHPLSQPLFPYQSVDDGALFEFGDVRAVVKLTPGHTPDGTCLYLHFPKSAPQPQWVLTGDTLFVGSVGRPDLLGDALSASELAARMYYSWNNVLSKLPDETRIFPAHGAGSLCGAHISNKPFSTIQEEKHTNLYLQQKNLMDFIAVILEGIPESPQYFKYNAQLNRTGPKLIDWKREIPALSPTEVQEKAQNGTWLIDIRDPQEFAENHVSGSIHIGLRGRFENWVGTILPWGTPFILIGSDSEIKEAVLRLTRVGYDDPSGFLKGSVDAWKQANLPLQKLALVAPRDLYQQIQTGKAPLLVDVRLPKEWQALRIHSYLVNLPLHRLLEESIRLNPEIPVLTVCNSAYRSSMAASLLQKKGFK